jgi:site-specific DNA recombinase
MTTRAIGYVRVSKAREEMISPELQVTAIQDYCSRTGAHLVTVITDLDQTGRNFAREGIQAAISQVEAKAADLVVVWKWSRFGRNVRDCLINIDRLEVAGGRLVAATEDFDDTPVGRFGRGQFLLMAQFESERIGEQWKEAQARRLRQGLPYNGRARYGYTYVRGVGYQPDPIPAAVLASIYDRYIAGESPNRIAASLNDLGIPAPRGGPWWSTAVQQVMESGFAAGLLRVNTRTGPQRKASTPRYEPGAHPAVISMDTWEAYLRKRKLNSAKAPYERSPAQPFAGIARCGTCGGSMYRAAGDDRLVCSAKRQHRTCERPAHTRVSALEAELKVWLAQVATDINKKAEIRAEASKSRAQDRQKAKMIAREATRLDAALARLTRQVAEGIIPTEAYITTRDQLLAEMAQAERLLTELTDAAADYAPPTRLAPDLLKEWDSLDDLGRHSIIAALLTRVEVHPRGKGYKPRLTFIPKWERSTTPA